MNPEPATSRPNRRWVIRSLLLPVLALSGIAVVHADGALGTFGFVVKVETDGIFNPRLKSVIVVSVIPGLPAAAAGIAAGDSVLQVEGKPIAGAAASDMAALMKKAPGDKLLLKLRRGGDEYTVSLTAVQRP
jgi:C-terminal processing protease CtpA/Prc